MSNSNNAVQLVTVIKNSKTKEETPNYRADNWRLVGNKTQLDEENSADELSSHKTVNQLTSKVTPHKIVPTSRLKSTFVRGDFTSISQSESSNTQTSIQRMHVPSGIGCLSPVKAKNPHDIAKILGTGFDKGSRKLGWLTSNNMKIPIDSANIRQTQMSNTIRSLEPMGNSVCNIDERHVNNNPGCLMMNSPKYENHMVPTNLRSCTKSNISNSNYTNGLDDENLSSIGMKHKNPEQ